MRPSAGPAPFTAREWEAVRHLCAGRTYGEMGRAMGIATHTVKNHCTSVYAKVGGGRTELLSYVARRWPALLGRREAETNGDIILYG